MINDNDDNDKPFFVRYHSHTEETFNQKYLPSHVLGNIRLEICSKVYMTGFSGQKCYTLKETA